MERPSITSLLLATDFSRNAAQAFDWAVEAAGRHRAMLHIVHAVDAASLGSMPHGLQEEVGRNLETLVRLAADNGVEATTRFESAGRAWEIVLAAERELAPDLLVIGSRGHTPYTHLLIGSTADRVVRGAACPVVTVPGPDARGPVHNPPKTILIATDFSEAARLATDAVLRLLDGTDSSRVVLLHANHAPIEYEADAVAVVIARELVETERAAREGLERIASALPSGVDSKIVVRVGYPAAVIREEAIAVNADLIVLGTHGRGGFERLMLGSVAERVLHHAPCPVLTMRQPVVESAASEPPAAHAGR